MDAYIGTKIVLAEPAAEFKPGDLRAPGRDGYRVVYEDGYVSWSPKETFERAYRKVTPAEGMLASGTYPAQQGQRTDSGAAGPAPYPIGGVTGGGLGTEGIGG